MVNDLSSQFPVHPDTLLILHLFAYLRAFRQGWSQFSGPTPEQTRQTAMAASATGDTGDAYYYMSEYHISNGDLPLANQQLELALASPNLTSVQRQRFRARLDEIREWLREQRLSRASPQ